MMRNIFPLILILSLNWSCEEPYEPEISPESRNLLVVEGNLQDNITTIKLSRTSALKDTGLIPETGALVKVYNTSGTYLQHFNSSAPGIYTADLQLTNQEKYILEISSSDGEIYRTEALQVLDAPPIDEINWDIINDRLRIKLSSKGNTSNSPYYRYTFTETWKYQSAYPTSLIYRNGAVEYLPPDERFYECYMTEESQQIVLSSTEGLQENTVSEKVITEINPLTTYRLNFRYSILVQQYNISAGAFDFYDRLKGNTEELGTLFDPQPSQLISNIYNINGEKDVIGFITAGNYSQKRIFIDRLELPFTEYYNDLKQKCSLDTLPPPMSPFNALFYFENDGYMPVARIGGGYVASSIECIDCRSQGGTTQKPSFW